MVSLVGLTVLTYSPSTLQTVRRRMFILYNGQHYDSLTGVDGTSIYTIKSEEDIARLEAAAMACATEIKNQRDIKLRERTRTRLKCLGCNDILDDPKAFEQHCMSVEHADDFCFDCEEIVVTEQVKDVGDD